MAQRIYTEIHAKSTHAIGQMAEEGSRSGLTLKNFSQVHYSVSREYGSKTHLAPPWLSESVQQALGGLSMEDSTKVLLQWYMSDNDFWAVLNDHKGK